MPDGHVSILPAQALVKDLHFGTMIKATCKACGHETELQSSLLRSFPHVILAMRIGEFAEIVRCTACDSKGAWLEAEEALNLAPRG
jgi:hypothetical protein